MHTLPGGALTTFPCKFGPTFFPPWEVHVHAPSAPPGYAYVSIIRIKTIIGGNCDALQLDAARVVLGFNYEAHIAPVYKFKNSARPVSAIGARISVFWPNSYCACAETPISEVLVKFLTPSFLFGTDILTIGGCLPCELDL